MNARLTLSTDLAGLMKEFAIETVLAEPPGQDEPLVPNRPAPVIMTASNGRSLDQYTWGVFPYWAKESIHASSDTISEHPGFRELFRRQRCVIPCDGFYGFRQEGKQSSSCRFHLKDGSVFGLAAVYDVWQSQGRAEYRSFTILKTPPNRTVAGYQDWMPAVLSAKAMELWLNPRVTDPDLLHAAIGPYRREDMTASPVPNDRSGGWRIGAKRKERLDYGSVKP